MNEQFDLFPAKAPSVSPEDVALLIQVLSGSGWMTSKQLASAPQLQARFCGPAGGQKLANFERRIRAIAQRSNGYIISYPGSPGYRLTLEAKIEEIQTATAKLRHQAGEMLQRALQIDRVYHGKMRPSRRVSTV